jgi:muconolactone delta-isomerase
MMEFPVDMVTTVADGTTDAEVDVIRIREATRSRELAAAPGGSESDRFPGDQC